MVCWSKHSAGGDGRSHYTVGHAHQPPRQSTEAHQGQEKGGGDRQQLC